MLPAASTARDSHPVWLSKKAGKPSFSVTPPHTATAPSSELHAPAVEPNNPTTAETASTAVTTAFCTRVTMLGRFTKPDFKTNYPQ